MSFNDELKNVTDSVRNVLNQNNTIGKTLTPELQKAASTAGTEARSAGRVPVETRNKIFTQHMMDNAGSEILTTGQASQFMDIAMNAYNNGAPE
tara:strand:- start:1251 stop:1532 length:282 start_codon:yes stop_codon:yes gene_type:complete